ncbi:MAG: hypothetical protein ACK5JU_05580 [Bacteroidales bacterium]
MREIVLDIKKRLRLSMNGAVSSNMRTRGMDYRVNFGVSIPTLRAIASNYTPSAELAWLLMGENSRECKLLAIFLYPVNECTQQTIDRFIQESTTNEMVDLWVQRFIDFIPSPCRLIQNLLAEDNTEHIYTGIQLLTRIAGKQIVESELNALIPSLLSVLTREKSAYLSGALFNCLEKCLSTFPSLSESVNVETNKLTIAAHLREEIQSITGYFTLLK